MKVFAVLVLLSACVLLAQAGFNDAVQQLARFQDSHTGAFQSNLNSAPTLEATSDALFLASLYGIRSKINAFQTEEYLQSLRTSENGYSSTPSGSATMEATFNAVVSHVNLGKDVPQSSNVVNYVLSLVDSSSKLFANNAGGRGNIKSTYHAIATLSALDSLFSIPEDVESSIVELLEQSFVNGPSGKYFSFTNVPAVKSNYYGTYIWNALNDDLLEPEENFKFILSQQNPQGGFFSDLQHSTTSYESSSLAISTVGILGRSGIDYTERLNVIALVRYCNQVTADLSETAAAHKTVAHTGYFSDNFKFIVEYGGADTRGTNVLQGTQLRPEIVVRSFSGPSHANLDVNVRYTGADGESKSSKMVWDEENQKYVSPQSIDTSNRLGKVLFEYDMELNTFGVRPVHFSQSAEKTIGYRVNIVPTAVNENTGAAINEGEPVSAGTNFDFDVKLSNKTHSNIKSGNFDVSLSVYDSSYIVIDKQSMSGVNNAELFKFSYSLTESNIPNGELNFVVSVEDRSTGAMFSNNAIPYTVSTPMVASNVQFNEESYTLGSFFSVSFVPGNSPDLHQIISLASPESQRKFVLDVTTSSGVVARSVVGQNSNGKYSFEFGIPASYESLGNFVVSFKYETARGEVLVLDVLENGEISEEPLGFSVDAELEAEILEKPTSTNFFYGNDVTYKLRVNDKVTGSSVNLGQRGGVFLTLNHYDKIKERSFTSTKLPAVQDGNDLVINWKVNPNAASGDGTLVLIAEGPGGDDIPILVAGKLFSTAVNIGGDIKENVTTFSSDDYYSSQTAFIVQFDLSCNSVPLRDVKLRAVVEYEGEEVVSTPVGVFDDKYIASWNSLHIDSPSGDYIVKFYREADQQRASDNEEWKQKQLRAKQREAELSGEKFNEQAYLASLETVEIEPLFTVNVPHTMVSRGGLPFGTEWLILIPVTIGFLYFDNVKRQYKRGDRK